MKFSCILNLLKKKKENIVYVNGGCVIVVLASKNPI
jgi:hypothetical protein